jgi:hypothetical protein
MQVVAAILCFLVAVPGSQAQQSIDGKHDIAQLLNQAKQSFDLTKEDAVLLFDGQKAVWSADGRLAKSVHRIIWIGTEVAIERYGDHRVPYDNDRCTFTVATVRTWRDGQWWETGATGKVETLPFALNAAYDYTNMREMLLLHNGIELPCILELAYTIEDKQPFRSGADGLWLFQREEPAVRSWFGLGLPQGEKPNVFVSAGAPRPEVQSDESAGIEVTWWKMGPLEAQARPHTSDPAAYTPHVAWSTWKTWGELRSQLAGPFESAMTIDEQLKTGLDSVLQKARNNMEKATLIAGFVNGKAAFVNYPEEFWWALPRSATRTFESGYGHRLDRAVLGATLFKEAGFAVRPVFLGTGYGNVNTDIATLSRLGGIGVWVTDSSQEAWYYDPSAGTVLEGSAVAWGRTTWIFPAAEPHVFGAGEDLPSYAEVRVDLAYDKNKAKFVGTGYFSADNALSPHGRMVGVGDEAKKYLAKVVSGCLKEARITSFNPSRFDTRAVSVGFEMELKKPEGGDSGRVTLVIGEPAGLILDRLPGDVRLFHKERTSPVSLPGQMSQKVTFRLSLDGLKVHYRPADRTVDNAAGRSVVTVGVHDSTLVITRELRLSKAIYEPAEWPLLRALLLAEKHDRNQTLIMTVPAADKGDSDKKEADKE